MPISSDTHSHSTRASGTATRIHVAVTPVHLCGLCGHREFCVLYVLSCLRHHNGQQQIREDVRSVRIDVCMGYNIRRVVG